MFDEQNLWRERFSRVSKELSRYLRYIFNGHLVIVMVFLLGTAAYYYQEWLRTLSSDFPVPLIMAVILSFILTYSPIYTFLSEADRIFLLPLESKLAGYFRKSIFVSFLFQGYLLIMGLGVLMPLYARVNEGRFQTFLPFLLVLLGLKVLNLLIRWNILYYVERKVHLLDSFVRYAVNTVFLYLLFTGAGMIYLLPVAGLLVILYVFFHLKTREKGLKWELLIDQEEKRMTSFYRLANMFTDVPKLKDRVKRRKWLDWILRMLPYLQQKTYSHLYARTFIRAGDYLGLFLRLTLIGMGLIWFITFGYGQILLVLLFIYLTGFQLLPLWNHHQHKLWIRLYPVEESTRKASFQHLLSAILYVQTILLSLTVMLKGEWLAAALSLIAGIMFSYFFSKIYIKKKLQS